MQALAQAEPGIAQAVIGNAVPQNGPKRAAAMLFMLAALRGGEISGWLGEPAMQVLRRQGRGDLARQLGSDFASLQRLSQDSAADWRAFFFPVYDGDWQQLRLFIHRHKPHHEQAGDDDPGERFVVEADLSRLGPIQLDGLIRNRRFDMILRSQLALEETWQNDIKGIFAAAIEAGGFTGAMRFQQMSAFPVTPIRDLPIEGPSVVV